MEEEVIEGGAGALAAFFAQFGKMDIYAQIVLEEFLRELIIEEQK